MTAAAYDGWKTDMLAGKITLMAAMSGADVTALAARARADRVTAGQVEPDGAALRDGTQAGEGDWIVTRRNNRRLTTAGGEWVKNGDAWTVEQRHRGGALTVAGTTHGGRVTLPAEYVREHVQLLYATTAHRAQGATVDTAHPLITAAMTRESLYVLASRARHATTLYVATHDQPDPGDDASTDASRHDPDHHEARETLLNILASDGAACSATQTISAAQDHAASLAALVPAYLHASRAHAGARPMKEPHGPNADRALPWAPAPPADGTPLARYLRQCDELICGRAALLADTAITGPAPWLMLLGPPPADPRHRADWTALVTIIAAYRDQHHITTSDPAHPLGPHPDPDHPSHQAHQHARDAARAAKRLAARDHPTPAALPDLPEPSDGPGRTRARTQPAAAAHAPNRQLAPAMHPAAPLLTRPRTGEPADDRRPRGPVR
jgi:hypothetical protein